MSTVVGAVPRGDTFQGVDRHGATGSRDVLIISQDETIKKGEDIIHRRQAELTSDDKRELERLDLPPDQWEDDASIIAARHNKDPKYCSSIIDMIKKQARGATDTVKYVMKQIEIAMNNMSKTSRR